MCPADQHGCSGPRVCPHIHVLPKRPTHLALRSAQRLGETRLFTGMRGRRQGGKAHTLKYVSSTMQCLEVPAPMQAVPCHVGEYGCHKLPEVSVPAEKRTLCPRNSPAHGSPTLTPHPNMYARCSQMCTAPRPGAHFRRTSPSKVRGDVKI